MNDLIKKDVAKEDLKEEEKRRSEWAFRKDAANEDPDKMCGYGSHYGPHHEFWDSKGIYEAENTNVI